MAYMEEPATKEEQIRFAIAIKQVYLNHKEGGFKICDGRDVRVAREIAGLPPKPNESVCRLCFMRGTQCRSIVYKDDFIKQVDLFIGYVEQLEFEF